MYQLSKVTCEKYAEQLNAWIVQLEASRKTLPDVEVFYKKLWYELRTQLKYVSMVSTLSRRFCGFDEYGFPAVRENYNDIRFNEPNRDDGYFPFADTLRRETAGVYVKTLMDRIEANTAITFPKQWKDRDLIYQDVYFGMKKSFKYSYQSFLTIHDIEDTPKNVDLYNKLIGLALVDSPKPDLENVYAFMKLAFKEYDLDTEIKTINELLYIFNCGIDLDVETITLSEKQGTELLELVNV